MKRFTLAVAVVVGFWAGFWICFVADVPGRKAAIARAESAERSAKSREISNLALETALETLRSEYLSLEAGGTNNPTVRKLQARVEELQDFGRQTVKRARQAEAAAASARDALSKCQTPEQLQTHLDELRNALTRSAHFRAEAQADAAAARAALADLEAKVEFARRLNGGLQEVKP